jgi:hypothetical protein
LQPAERGESIAAGGNVLEAAFEARKVNLIAFAQPSVPCW